MTPILDTPRVLGALEQALINQPFALRSSSIDVNQLITSQPITTQLFTLRSLSEELNN